MKARTFQHRLASRSALAAILLAAAACSNPVDGEHEEHAVGLSISNAQGQSVATIDATAGTVTGELTVQVGASHTYTVAAIGEDGDVIAVTGDELTLGISARPQQANIELEGANRIVVTGLTAGAGTVRIVLEHDGHEEFAGTVPVVVLAAAVNQS